MDGGGHVHHAGDGAPGAVQEQHDRRVAVEFRQEPAVDPLAARPGAEPHVDVAEARHARGLADLRLREANEPVGEVPQEDRAGGVRRDGRDDEEDRDEPDRPQHGALAYSRRGAASRGLRYCPE